MTINISDRLIEKAAGSIHRGTRICYDALNECLEERGQCVKAAEVALEAVADELRAEAWEEGHSWGWSDAQDAHEVRQEMDRADWDPKTPNHYLPDYKIAAIREVTGETAQEPTDAEVEAAAEAWEVHTLAEFHEDEGEMCCRECGEAFDWMPLDGVRFNARRRSHRFRTALSAARAARRNEEER